MDTIVMTFRVIFGACMEILKTPISIYGFTFDLFGVLVFVSIGSLLWFLVSQILIGGGSSDE